MSEAEGRLKGRPAGERETQCDRFAGKVAVVTGAAAGFGLAVATRRRAHIE